MTIADDPEEFRNHWSQYISGLGRLKLATADADRIERIQEAQDELESVVNEIADNVSENNQS